MRRLAALVLFATLLAGCDSGDWLGPLERGAREALFAWDMWSTDAVRPHETPMPDTPEGTVPVTGVEGWQEGLEDWRNLTEEQRAERSALTYRRYCHHCHGENGDSRTIVGESFSPAPPDLRSDEVQGKSTRALFDAVHDGSDVMIPLGDTLTPLEIHLALEHVRSLRDAPSEPYFDPKNVEPVE